MNRSPNHPYYKHTPIKSIQALSRALKIDPENLVKIAENAENLWKPPFELKKDDGSSRLVLDATARLKAVHRRIHSEIFSHVHYPSYITGSVKGFDYSANAAIHVNKSIVIAEDIKSFFPSTTTKLVHEIWERFFGFSSEVAEILTKLTTKAGCLPQGGICSSYLANLAFWDIEPHVMSELKKLGIAYSRYVDDISASSKTPLNNEAKTQVITALYGMLIKKGYKPKRTKHEIHTQKKPMIVTKLVVNDKVSLIKAERDRIRASVFQLEVRVKNGERGHVIATDLTHIAGRVGVMNRFHKTEGSQLKNRLKVLRNILSVCSIQNTTLPIRPIASFDSDQDPF